MNVLVICLIICLLTVISYVWGKISMATTAMISLAAFVLTGCLDPNEALLNFGNSNGIMIMSMFVVAAGLQRTQFIKMISRSVNKIANGSITKVMFGYVIISIILSQFIQSPLIVFGIMSPMLIETCKDMNISPSKVMFPLGISAVATCSTLPLGSGATVAAELNGYLQANDYTQFVVSLTDPMKARLPVLIVCAVYCIFFAVKVAPDLVVNNAGAAAGGRKLEERPALNPFSEKAGYIIFILTTLGLIFQQNIPRSIIAPTWLICFIGALLMVLCGVLSGREACGAMNIPMYLLFVGSMAMGSALAASGAGAVVGDFLANMATSIGNPYLIGTVFFIVPFLLTQVMQNRAVMLIFIPITIQACKSLGANPIGLIILVQAACLTAFMTPMGTPAVPLIMATGGYDIKSILKQSMIPAILFSIVSIFWVMTVMPLF
ncbi:SLC13 family permease [Anaerobium acetethylicum]|uniref:Di-and tricarboxylate transporter n=1 Tax=Anaerobium acetethylicum TaxID=1619234 RepID=A0A1D3TUC4_9FIRM|nr:SLC13 family permease [Anaerobium acetethylicum]SCP97658.1 Di-and tricarboxylate transporter [Anaerobium acetethylicum]